MACLYLCAALQFTRYYIHTTIFYLNMQAYLNGRERLPFQERVLPILLLRPVFHSSWLMQHLAHSNGAFTPELGPVYFLSFVSLLLAGVYTQKLYGLVSETGALNFLVFPTFLFAAMWTYSIHSEANFSYPYDLPSLFFFSAGLYYIYKRSFLPLALIVLIGTFNRETTLFLIGIYVIDSATRRLELSSARSEAVSLLPPWRRLSAYLFEGRFDPRLVSWGRVVLLFTMWGLIKGGLQYAFRHNSNAENFLRINYNLDRLRLRLLPALLNICGYTIPIVVLCSGLLRPRRFQNYLYILPFWLAVMFCSGVLVETRIYGELCSFAAVALVVIMENYSAGKTGRMRRLPDLQSSEPESQSKSLAA